MKLSIGLMKRKRTCANYLLVQNRTRNMAVVLNTMTSQIDVNCRCFREGVLVLPSYNDTKLTKKGTNILVA